MVPRVYSDICPICSRVVQTDIIDRMGEHRRREHGGAVDVLHLEAMREVDALTPACPPIAPPRPLDLSTLLVPDAAAAEVYPGRR